MTIQPIYTPWIASIDAAVAQHPGATIVVPSRREQRVIQRRYSSREVTTPNALIGCLLPKLAWVNSTERRKWLRRTENPPELILTRQWALNGMCMDQLPAATQQSLAAYASWLEEIGCFEFEDLLLHIINGERLSPKPRPSLLALEAQQYSPLTCQFFAAVSETCVYAGDPHAATLRRLGAGTLTIAGAPDNPPALAPATVHTYRSATALAEAVLAGISQSPGPLHTLGIVVRGKAEEPYILAALESARIPVSSQTLVEVFHTALARTVRLYLKWLARPAVRQLLRGPDAASARRFRLSTTEWQALVTSPWVGWTLDNSRYWLSQAERASVGAPTVEAGLNRAALSAEEVADEELFDRLLALIPAERMRRLERPPEETASRAAVGRWLNSSRLARYVFSIRVPRPPDPLAGQHNLLQFLDKYPQPTQALEAWAQREAEQTDDEMWQGGLRDNTVHVLQPSQVPPGGYRTLWVSGLSEGRWPAAPSMRRLQTLATLRSRPIETERAEHAAAERALWQAVQRGLDTGGQLHIHTLVGQESTLSRFVPQEETTELPAIEALTPEEYGIWLERQARLSLTGAGDPLDREARLALYAQQRDSVPRPPVLASAPELERSVWTEPVRVSPSQLEAYQDCPQRFVYAYVYRIGLDDEEGYLGFGNLVHTLIQEAFTFALPAWNSDGEMPLAGMPASLPAGRRRTWLLERLYALATSERYRFASGYRAIELERRLKAFAFLQGILDEGPADPEFTVLAVEHTLNASVPGLSSEEVTITGKIDRIDRLANTDQVKLWDFKTGKRPSGLDLATIEGVQRKVRAAIQLSSYARVAASDPYLSTLGQVGDMEYRYLPEIAAGYPRGIPAASPPPEGDEAGEFDQLLSGLTLGILDGQFTINSAQRRPCRTCSFAAICPLLDAQLASLDPDG
jgi:hypothetical protein